MLPRIAPSGSEVVHVLGLLSAWFGALAPPRRQSAVAHLQIPGSVYQRGVSRPLYVPARRRTQATAIGQGGRSRCDGPAPPAGDAARAAPASRRSGSLLGRRHPLGRVQPRCAPVARRGGRAAVGPTTCRPCRAARTSPRPTRSPAGTATPSCWREARARRAGHARGVAGSATTARTSTDGFVDTRAARGGRRSSGLLANLVFFTALLWTVARPLGWVYAAWQPGLRVPGGCTAGLSADAARAPGASTRSALTGPGAWALTAGRRRPGRRRARAGRAHVPARRGRCATTLRRMAVAARGRGRARRRW